MPIFEADRGLYTDSLDIFGNVRTLELPALAGRFGIVPFTVFDAAGGEWRRRKQEWIKKVELAGEAGRDSEAQTAVAYTNQGALDALQKTKPKVENICSPQWNRGQETRVPEVVPGGGGPNSVRRLAASSVGKAFNSGEPGDINRKLSAAEKKMEPGGGGGPNSAWLGRGSNDGAHGTHGMLGMSDSSMRIAGGYHTEDGQAKSTAGTSIFDPVLCEIGYRWFGKIGGSILDPFAGGSTRGLVAAWLGYQYTGIELRQGQVDANRAQFTGVKEKHDRFYADEIAAGKRKPMSEPSWLVGDSEDIEELLPIGEQYDLVFSCPPYFDLEMYSLGNDARTKMYGLASDGSMQSGYKQFLVWYEKIYRQCVNRLRDNRFCVTTVGEIRDEKGYYRHFVSDTERMFERLGLHFYNEAILVTARGSLPVRVGSHFPNYRKLGKTHQNILVYWKGNDYHKIPEELGILTSNEFTEA